jgi:hypothetical protein
MAPEDEDYDFDEEEGEVAVPPPPAQALLRPAPPAQMSHAAPTATPTAPPPAQEPKPQQPSVAATLPLDLPILGRGSKGQPVLKFSEIFGPSEADAQAAAAEAAAKRRVRQRAAGIHRTEAPPPPLGGAAGAAPEAELKGQEEGEEDDEEEDGEARFLHAASVDTSIYETAEDDTQFFGIEEGQNEGQEGGVVVLASMHADLGHTQQQPKPHPPDGGGPTALRSQDGAAAAWLARLPAFVDVEANYAAVHQQEWERGILWEEGEASVEGAGADGEREGEEEGDACEGSSSAQRPALPQQPGIGLGVLQGGEAEDEDEDVLCVLSHLPLLRLGNGARGGGGGGAHLRPPPLQLPWEERIAWEGPQDAAEKLAEGIGAPPLLDLNDPQMVFELMRERGGEELERAAALLVPYQRKVCVEYLFIITLFFGGGDRAW